MTCLHPDPAHRFASARELARALERCGVELFDETQLASLVGERLPETKRSLQRLVGLAQKPELDGEAVKAELKSLRSADKGTPLPPRPVLAPVTTRAPTLLQPQPSFVRPVVAAVGGVALIAVVSAWFATAGAGTQAAAAPDPVAVAGSQRARAALDMGDPLSALEIIRKCVSPRGPCLGLEVVRKEAQARLAASPCGTEEKARAWIEEASLLLSGDALDARLRECTAGKRMHPLAKQALQQRELERMGR